MTGRRRWGHLLLLAPLPLFVALVDILPFLGVVRWSVTLPEPGLSQYARVFTDPIVLGVLLRTLRVCLLVTAITVLLGYVLSWLFGTRRQRIVVEFGS